MMKKISNNKLDESILNWPIYMQRALDLACNVLNTTPNPRVGCVLVKGDRVVGEGWHVAAGEDHAEIMALKQAGANAESALAFVSLEPCAHVGRTGPCSSALIEAGVSKVIVASIDPNPEVAGQGVSNLLDAGIEVIQLVDFDQVARQINPGYFKRRESGLPFVRCKLAMSLDGRTALANGESKWITGPAARADVQRLRAESSAIITGIETVLADDPFLNVRAEELDLDSAELARNGKALSQQPLRVVLDSKRRIPESAKILALPGDVKIFGAVAEDAKLAANVEYIASAKSGERVSLQFVLESLASDFSCTEVLVEAGPVLSTAFIQAGLVDELIVYIAPKLLGSDARALLNVAGLKSMSETVDFEISDASQLGGDIRLVLKPATVS